MESISKDPETKVKELDIRIDDLRALLLTEQKSDEIIFSKTSTTPTQTTSTRRVTVQTPPRSPKNIHLGVSRSGSSAHVIRNEDGSILSLRKNPSAAEIYIAAKSKLSNPSQPNIFSSAVDTVTSKAEDHNPIFNAKDAIERTAGRGDYFEHLWPLEALSDNYNCCLNFEHIQLSQGLSEEDAKKRLDEFGPNVLTPPAKVPLWLLFLLQFTNLLIVLLMITACLTLILYGVNPSNPTNLYLGILLWIVIILTCYETFVQEAKSDSLMEKFRTLMPEAASVIRDGTAKPLPASDLVPGDIINLQSGQKIPADCRVIWTDQSFKVDQSSLTGESEPVNVFVESKSQIALESKNIIFNGSLCVEGSCLAVVIRTGDGTLIGKMVGLTADTGKSTSTLQADIVYFVRFLTLFALAQAVLIFIVGLSKGYDPVSVFINGFVIIMIGNVPQGLPTTITACLWIVAERMAKHNVFVKKLDIIETLGSCTCICTDKTGTLTQNVMTVANIWVYNSKYTNNEFVKNIKQQNDHYLQMRILLDIATMNSRVFKELKPSKLDSKTDVWTPIGDATELGLYRFCDTSIQNIETGIDNFNIDNYRKSHQKVFEIPFNSSNKFQMSIHNIRASSGLNFIIEKLMYKDNLSETKYVQQLPICHQIMFVKGAPDVLLDKCCQYLAEDGSIHIIDELFSNTYNNVYEDFGGNGERVLGFAMLPLDKTYEDELIANEAYDEDLKERLIGKKNPEKAIKNLIFVGLITLRDPPRDEVPQAIKECYEASIKVVMVTGDHPLTAEAIARNIGLITQPTQRSLAKARKVPIDRVSKDDPEIGAVVVRGVEISGSQYEGIPPMSDEDWHHLLTKKEIVFARTSPENKLTIVQQFTKAKHVCAMTGDGVNDSPALKQAAIGIAMGLNGSDVAKEAANIILLDDNFASIVVGVREGRLLFANLKKSVAYTLAHLTPEVVPVLLWAFTGVPQPMGSLLALCIDLLTELAPASSLAYEYAESLIMKVPPRNVKTDKLTSFPLLFYAYFQAGFILTGGCLFTYFLTFQAYGITPSDLFSMNNQYFPSANGDDYINSDGTVFSPDEQDFILTQVYSAWYMMIFCGQAAHIWVCRTTTVSIFEHGLLGNRYVNVAVIIAIGLGCLIVYTPGISTITQSGGPESQLIIVYASLLVAGCLWIWTETRKYFSRRDSNKALWFNKIFSW